MVKSSSKYMSYENLKYIQDNNYISKQDVEYCKEEIDKELYSKMSKKDEQQIEKLLKQRGY